MKRIAIVIIVPLLLAGCRHKAVQLSAPSHQEIGSCAPAGKIECADTAPITLGSTSSYFVPVWSPPKPVGDPVPACVQKYEDGSLEFKECPK